MKTILTAAVLCIAGLAPAIAVQPVTNDEEGMELLRRQKTATRECASDEAAVREDGFIRCLKSVREAVADARSGLAEKGLDKAPGHGFTYAEAARRFSDLEKPSKESLAGMWILVGEVGKTDSDIGAYDAQGIDHQQATTKVRGRLIFEPSENAVSGSEMIVHPVALRDTNGHYFMGGSPLRVGEDAYSARFSCRYIRIVNLVGASEDRFTYRCKAAGADELLCAVELQNRFGLDELTQYQLFRKIRSE